MASGFGHPLLSITAVWTHTHTHTHKIRRSNLSMFVLTFVFLLFACISFQWQLSSTSFFFLSVYFVDLNFDDFHALRWTCKLIRRFPLSGPLSFLLLPPPSKFDRFLTWQVNLALSSNACTQGFQLINLFDYLVCIRFEQVACVCVAVFAFTICLRNFFRALVLPPLILSDGV